MATKIYFTAGQPITTRMSYDKLNDTKGTIFCKSKTVHIFGKKRNLILFKMCVFFSFGLLDQRDKTLVHRWNINSCNRILKRSQEIRELLFLLCIINENDFRIALYIKHETKNDIFRKCRLLSREHKNGKPVECVLYLKFIPLGLYTSGTLSWS